MGNRKNGFLIVLIVLAAFLAGRWTRSGNSVKADSGDTPQVEVREVTAGTSLVVHYPSLKKVFVYQNPFVGLPKWSCSYSVQLSTPGGDIVRQPCNGLSGQ